jgi:hypothetical protein
MMCQHIGCGSADASCCNAPRPIPAPASQWHGTHRPAPWPVQKPRLSLWMHLYLGTRIAQGNVRPYVANDNGSTVPSERPQCTLAMSAYITERRILHSDDLFASRAGTHLVPPCPRPLLIRIAKSVDATHRSLLSQTSSHSVRHPPGGYGSWIRSSKVRKAHPFSGAPSSLVASTSGWRYDSSHGGGKLRSR